MSFILYLYYLFITIYLYYLFIIIYLYYLFAFILEENAAVFQRTISVERKNKNLCFKELYRLVSVIRRNNKKLLQYCVHSISARNHIRLRFPDHLSVPSS